MQTLTDAHDSGQFHEPVGMLMNEVFNILILVRVHYHRPLKYTFSPLSWK